MCLFSEVRHNFRVMSMNRQIGKVVGGLGCNVISLQSASIVKLRRGLELETGKKDIVSLPSP